MVAYTYTQSTPAAGSEAWGELKPNTWGAIRHSEDFLIKELDDLRCDVRRMALRLELAETHVIDMTTKYNKAVEILLARGINITELV